MRPKAEWVAIEGHPRPPRFVEAFAECSPFSFRFASNGWYLACFRPRWPGLAYFGPLGSMCTLMEPDGTPKRIK